MADITRRIVLASIVGSSAALALSAAFPSASGAEDQELESDAELPRPDRSGIEHIVLVMMENRSFDHFLGWLPGHDGRQAGLSYADAAGTQHATHRLAPDFQGCGHSDPDHSFGGARVEYDNGTCDGFLRAAANDVFSIGYYLQQDLPFFGRIAPHFATPDGYFAAILGPTFPNRIFQHAGQTDRISNTLAISQLPTVWDRLAAAGVSAHYYSSDLPVVALWGAKYLPIARPVSAFLTAAATGTLPAVSYIDPGFLGELTGTSNDDHPFNDIRNGQFFLDTLYKAVTSGPAWRNTLFIINYDEWGGFFEHVPPPPGAVTPAEQALGYTDGLRGFRVPCVVISPWSQHRGVSHAVYDHTSVLKLIEWRYGLEPLSVRDAQARNLAHVLNFDRPRLDVPQANVAPGPYGSPCLAAGAATPTLAQSTREEWLGLRDMARQNGWSV